MEMAQLIGVYLAPAVSLIVGIFAFIVYRMQKTDKKKSAANMILLEIQHIEKAVKATKNALRTDNINNIEFDIIRDDVWAKYGYMFTRDFDADELNTISDFFQNAKLLDEAVKKSRESFNEDVAQIRINKQRILADLSAEALQKPSENSITMFMQKAEAFDKLYMSVQEKYLYTPVKYTNDARKYCEDLSIELSITTIGLKLKAIIGKK